MKEQKKRMTGECVVLYRYICQKLASGGLSREKLDSIKHHPMGHHSVGNFVEANLKLGDFEWRDDMLVNASRKLTLKLTSDEEGKLETKASAAGLTVAEFASSIILNQI